MIALYWKDLLTFVTALSQEINVCSGKAIEMQSLS